MTLSVDDVFAPVKTKARVQSLDVIRRVAILGILPVNSVSTNLNGCAGLESLQDGSREVVRVALFGPDAPTGTFTRWENTTIPW